MCRIYMKNPKSKQAIIDTYIDIRKTTPIEKMTVVSLCKKANINKSTFYVYYQDIFDLCEQIEDIIVEKITSSIQHPELAIDHTDIFTEEVFKAYQQYNDLIHTLFSGSRKNALPDKIHHSLTNLFFQLRPEYKNNPEKHIMFSYMIYGSYYAYMENMNYNSQYVISVISALTKI